MSSDSTVEDRKSTRLNSSHVEISYAVFCLKKKNHRHRRRSCCSLTSPSCRRRARQRLSWRRLSCLFFFFNDTATTEIYTLSLHDALPISNPGRNPATVSIAVSVDNPV